MDLEIYLTRHGETEFNTQAQLQGWADSPLTENGRQMAHNLGEKLRQCHFQAAFCSTLPRTQATAELILQGAKQDLPINRVADLREYHFGEFEGKPAQILYDAIVAAKNLPDTATWLHQYRHGTYNQMAETASRLDPSAETEAQFVGRLWRGMGNVLANSPKNGRVLVVTHGMAIVALLKSLDSSAILYKSPPNASVSRLHFNGENWHILSVAQTEF
ncbi:histidine phosphatase family protein [Alysiella filiformis]|uniref:Probable phosphoglycerate mutase n=1 Tax=Alysiella filiformis DSM 16848 TaxID=1120981 RepID=A0A286EB40_9NEIS|nr:histidine phosphatase family protein [Alysiella filiformis]QMT32244.1 histidine phosphatase family protein [Alysiella filiformis]UBQ56835.1 histidine phosphatase family protein [Alysiella filiformis DSM 16848]SOD68054.1 probable phosphoglycerate mutase [Alysiella filiformis DSM 16848]